MAIETFGNNIGTLVATNPSGADGKNTADDHIRGLKAVLLAQFSALTAPVTATAAELNRVAGVTSAIQTQLDAKAPTVSPALTGTPTAPTATGGTATTQIATTAFTANAIAAVNAVSNLVRVNSDTATQTAAVGSLYEAHYAGVVAFTMPTTTTDGALCAFVTCNNYNNTVDFGAQTLLGPLGSLSGVVSLEFGNLACRWNQSKSKWVVTT